MCCGQNEHHKSVMHHEHSSNCECKCAGHSKHGNLEEYKAKLENELAIVNEKLAEVKGE